MAERFASTGADLCHPCLSVAVSFETAGDKPQIFTDNHGSDWRSVSLLPELICVIRVYPWPFPC